MTAPLLTTTDAGQIAARLFTERQAFARRQVAAGALTEDQADARLLPWAALAARAQADLPELMVEEVPVWPTGPARTVRLLDIEICSRAISDAALARAIRAEWNAAADPARAPEREGRLNALLTLARAIGTTLDLTEEAHA